MSFLNWNKDTSGRYISSFLDWGALSQHQRFELLDLYYNNNNLYEKEAMQAYWFDEWLEPIKPYRNPTHRSVEFFASKLCQGTPKISVTSKNAQVEQAIQQFLDWSDFNGNKRVMLRKDSLQGNLFVKIYFDGEKVYQEALETEYVTDFKEDSRGFLTEIRIDIPIENNMTYTEYWDAVDGYMAIWEHHLGTNAKLEQLGDAKEYHFLSEFGVDFIPIVHTKFNGTGSKWGKSCVEHAIVKIDEVNRKHTRMSELLFQYNKPIFGVTSNSRDDSGRPLPIKRLTAKNIDANKDDTNLFMYVEGADIKSLIPDLHWADVLAILKSDEEELEKDLPELRYFTLTENQASGIALQTLLAGAIDRAKEAQENFNNAQERANEMALTMGKFFGVFPSSIGSYEKGDFKHSISFNEIIPSSTTADKATTLAQLANAPEMSLAAKMALSGYSQDEIDMATSDTVSTPN